MIKIFFILLFVLHPSIDLSAEVQIAAASNFTSALEKIIEVFNKESGHKALASYGSTAKLYAQITNGAPFDVFLSADQEHVRKLVDQKRGLKDSVFTYAEGKLVLWSPKKNVVAPNGEALSNMEYKHLSIANPKLSPYGSAAQEVLVKKAFWQKNQSRLVMGENINHAHQFVASGNAELGFIALSQVIQQGKIQGSYWSIPQDLYTPLKQDAVLLSKGKNSEAARTFLIFLKNNKAKKIIEEFGYKNNND